MKLIRLDSHSFRSRRVGPLGEHRQEECVRDRDRARDAGACHGARFTPWRVVRRTADLVEVEHIGETPLHSVRFALAGNGILGLSLPCSARPGERMQVRVREVRDRSRTVLVLRWFEPCGTELLWPISL